jgi:hypothetical protein
MAVIAPALGVHNVTSLAGTEPYYFLPAIMNLALRAVRSTCRPRK